MIISWTWNTTDLIDYPLQEFLMVRYFIDLVLKKAILFLIEIFSLFDCVIYQSIIFVFLSAKLLFDHNFLFDLE